jgi:hypothetical protein
MLRPQIKGYNPAAAVAWADANCGTGTGGCAAFVSDALQAGHAGNPSMIWVQDIVAWVLAHGWKETGSECCGPPGAVVVLLDGEHVCLSVGDGLIDCHNIDRCHHSGNYGTGRRVFVPPA